MLNMNIVCTVQFSEATVSVKSNRLLSAAPRLSFLMRDSFPYIINISQNKLNKHNHVKFIKDHQARQSETEERLL